MNVQHRARRWGSIVGRDHITPDRGPGHWLHRRRRHLWPLLPIGIGVGVGLLLAHGLGWWV